MYKVMEVVGVSKKSYSDATQYAIAQLIKEGHKPSYFEVVSQRGHVNDTTVEFQVTLKVGVK